MVATESIEGLIILGLVVLFPDHPVCDRKSSGRKEPDDIEEDVNDPEPGYVKSRKRTEAGRKSTCQKNEGRRKKRSFRKKRHENTK